MDFLGIGPLELLLIALIAILAIGPRDIQKTARQIGRLLNQLYKSEAWRATQAAARELQTLPNRLAREAALETNNPEGTNSAAPPRIAPDGSGPATPAPEPAGGPGASIAAWISPGNRPPDPAPGPDPDPGPGPR